MNNAPLIAFGLAGLAALLMPRGVALLELHAPDGSGVSLPTGRIVAVEEGPLVSVDGHPGSTIRTVDGQQIRVTEPAEYVAGHAEGLVSFRSARPALRGAGSGTIYVRRTSVSSIRPSQLRVVGSTQRDVEVSLEGGGRILLRESIEDVRALLRGAGRAT